jgi:hypothetical protein
MDVPDNTPERTQVSSQADHMAAESSQRALLQVVLKTGTVITRGQPFEIRLVAHYPGDFPSKFETQD